MLVKTLTGEKDVDLLKVTPENYICPEGEENVYHCRIEVKRFDADTGKRLSTPRLQKFGRKAFETFEHHHLRNQGYTVDILHDPVEWGKGHKADLAKAKKAAEEAVRQAEREKMKAEILAELKASGAVPAEEPSKDGGKPAATK